MAALYLGPFAIPLYVRLGGAATTDWDAQGGAPEEQEQVHSVLSGGVASGLAHVVAVPLVVATGLTIAGLDMWAMVAVIAVLATGLIIAFDYVGSSRQGRRLSPSAAVAGAVLTVLAFDVGMLGWMLVLHYSDAMPSASDVRFTFLMQLGLILGSLTAFPVVRTLVSRRRNPSAFA